MNYMATLNSLMILAGGRGTRVKEYTEDIPKPMIEVAGKPLIVHIINIYRKFGINNVVILGGYKHEVIMNYFSENYKTDESYEEHYILKLIYQNMVPCLINFLLVHLYGKKI